MPARIAAIVDFVLDRFYPCWLASRLSSDSELRLSFLIPPNSTLGIIIDKVHSNAIVPRVQVTYGGRP